MISSPVRGCRLGFDLWGGVQCQPVLGGTPSHVQSILRAYKTCQVLAVVSEVAHRITPSGLRVAIRLLVFVELESLAVRGLFLGVGFQLNGLDLPF